MLVIRAGRQSIPAQHVMWWRIVAAATAAAIQEMIQAAAAVTAAATDTRGMPPSFLDVAAEKAPAVEAGAGVGACY